MAEAKAAKPYKQLQDFTVLQLFNDPALRRQILADRNCGIVTEAVEEDGTFFEIRIGEEKFRKSY